MLGLLVELVLLPLRLPPNQSALIFLYQDWTMGVLGLKLWHLLVVVAPRREGQGQGQARGHGQGGAAAAAAAAAAAGVPGAAPDGVQEGEAAAAAAAGGGGGALGQGLGEHGDAAGGGGGAGVGLEGGDDSWAAHFEALQREGFRNINCRRVLQRLVLPVVAQLGTALAAPYALTRGLLPLLGLPAPWLQRANLWAYAALALALAALAAVRRLRAAAAALHSAIRDDRYLVGRRLDNCDAAAARRQAEEVRRAGQQPGGVQGCGGSGRPQEQAAGAAGPVG
jgi:hypothetical protein